MPQNLEQLLNENFMNLFGFCASWVACSSVVLFFWVKHKGPKFPPRSSVTIRFEEKMASGRSHKSLLTRLGGARNCLNVIITGDELWITVMFPFNLIAYFYDGLQRIPLPLVRGASMSGRNVLVAYQRPDGTVGEYELQLKQPELFLTVLGQGA